MDFDIEVFERDAIAEVTIEPVGLFHDSDATAWILAEEAYHLAELLASCGLGRFHIDEFVDDFEFMRFGILAQQFQLRGNGIAFALLVFAGNASVDDGLSHAESVSATELSTARRLFVIGKNSLYLYRGVFLAKTNQQNSF